VQTATGRLAPGAAQAVAESLLRRRRRSRTPGRSGPAQAAPADQQPVHRQLLRRHRPANRHADQRGTGEIL